MPTQDQSSVMKTPTTSDGLESYGAHGICETALAQSNLAI
jgi:hypothetical protein